VSCASVQMLSWAGLGWRCLVRTRRLHALGLARLVLAVEQVQRQRLDQPRGISVQLLPQRIQLRLAARRGGGRGGHWKGASARPAGRLRRGGRAAGHGRRVAGSMHTAPKKKPHLTAGSPSTISPTSTETSLAASAAAATPLEQRSVAAGWPAGRQSGHPCLRAATSDPLSWWKAAAAASCDRGAALATCRWAATPRPSVERDSRRTPQASSVISATLKRPKGASGHLKAATGYCCFESYC
jgi:hypothetical protein